MSLLNSVFPLLAMPMVFSRAIHRCGNSGGKPFPTASLVAAGLWVGNVLILLYWSCIHVKPLDRLPWIVRIGLPRAVFLFSLLLTIITVLSPLSAYINPRNHRLGASTSLPMTFFTLLASMEPALMLLLGQGAPLLILVAGGTTSCFLVRDQ